MKKILVVVLVVAIALISANVAMATIAGSKHDLTSAAQGYGGSTNSSCAYCHTPHHPIVSPAPLWNKTLPLAGSYTLYGGGLTLANSVVAAPGANSLTCLSCHDGTLGVGSIVNGTSDTITNAGVLTAGAIDPAAAGYIGTDLGQSHPVGVVYDSTVTIAGLNAVVNVNNQVGGKAWKLYGGGDGVGTVQCGSCHDPHTTVAANSPFLKDTKATICSDCHSTK